jgi:hypothetical protein
MGFGVISFLSVFHLFGFVLLYAREAFDSIDLAKY